MTERPEDYVLLNRVDGGSSDVKTGLQWLDLKRLNDVPDDDASKLVYYTYT